MIAYDNLRINVYRYFMNECILNNLSVIASSRKVDDMLKMPTKQITDKIQNDPILITNRNKNINNDTARSNSVTSTKFSNDKTDSNKLTTGAICKFLFELNLPFFRFRNTNIYLNLLLKRSIFLLDNIVFKFSQS